MIITSKNVWMNEEFSPASLKIEDGKIVEIMPYAPEKSDVDYGDKKVIPGLIDIHDHGYKGGATEGKVEVYRNWQEYFPKEGVTTFLIGTQPSSEEKMVASIKGVRQVMEEHRKGADIHGIFLQGPFLSMNHHGSYDGFDLRKPTVEKVKEYIEMSGNNIRTISLAPETDVNHETIKYCVKNNIKVCLGFTGCTYEEAEQAIDEGASSVIHTFNCMAPIHHRNPHLPVAAMTDDRVYAEVMTDGYHVHPAIMNLVGRMKGKDKLISVTDSGSLKGLPVGKHIDAQGDEVEILPTGLCRRVSDGQIAGSVLPMIKNIQRMQEVGKLPLVTAINSCTCNPAKMLGIDNYKGYIKEGYRADIAVYDDNYEIVQTYVNGEAML